MERLAGSGIATRRWLSVKAKCASLSSGGGKAARWTLKSGPPACGTRSVSVALSGTQTASVQASHSASTVIGAQFVTAAPAGTSMGRRTA